MKQQEQKHYSGFVTIIGRPNVGKSSLMNRMIGEKIAIVSSRPQTTRSRIMGVLSQADYQIVFLDTPGIHDPRTRLGEYMMHSVRDAMDGMDAVLVIFDVTHLTDNDLSIATDMKGKKVPVILALNKIDLASPEEILAATAKAADAGFDEIIPVSAKTGSGIDTLLQMIAKALPQTAKRMRLCIPYTNGSFLQCIREEGKVFSEEYTADGTVIDALVDIRRQKAAEQYLLPDPE